jgi:uncharacterized protein (DUF342 family)
VSPALVDRAIADAAKLGLPLKFFPLMESLEAKAEVEINEDKTTAVLNLRKGTGECPPLNMKAISQAIKESRVHISNVEKLKADIQAFMKSKDLELKNYVLAEGKHSTRGKDRAVALSAPLLSQEEQAALMPRLRIRENSFQEEDFSLEDLTGFALVEKGAEVARVEATSKGEAGKDIYGHEIPALPGNDPDLKLYHGVELHGELITAGQSGLLLVKAVDQCFRAKLIDHADAKVTINISPDLMEARADMFRESGAGIPLSPEYVLKELNGQGIVKGINTKAVETACAQARAKGSCIDVVLAQGEMPIAKGGRAITWLVNLSQAETDELKKTAQVMAGTVIAEISAAKKEDRQGFNVVGDEFKADQDSVLEIEYDDSVQELPTEGGKRLIAGRSGALHFDGVTLYIDSFLEISGDVGPKTGAINFPGELTIRGNVLPGVTVIGGSEVFVAGTVKDAIVSSEGNVIISGGILGHGIVRARTSIAADFAEKATLMAVGDIRLNKASFNTIKTNGKLFVDADDGTFLGGVCLTKHGINAANIGSEAGGRTQISFGQDYLIKDQINKADEKIDKAKTALTAIEEKINSSHKNPQVLEQASKEKVKLVKLLEQLRLKVFTLEEQFEVHHESELRIRGTIYPGVVIESHGRYYEVQQRREGVIFYFDTKSGRIKERALSAGD